MPTYKAPLRDFRFVYQELFNAEDLQALPGFEEVSPDLVETIVEEAGKFCENVLQPLNQSGDAIGVKFENGQITTPPGWKEAYQAYAENGWGALTASPEYGGQGLPKTVGIMVEEILCGANLSFGLYPGLTVGAYNAIVSHGSEALKNKFLPNMVAGIWSGTMCLTEPQCGTDLGLIRTKAEPQADGSYQLTGTKIFITSGEHDFTENIIHLVLARLPDAPSGIKGISLFLVPKFRVDDNGNLGARNPVFCGSIEHKMGIKASATCVMNFDAAKGYLVGKENEGLAAMFVMMNYERLSMGIQGLGASEFAYQNAAQYATDRLQGRSASGVKSPNKPADSILVHGDVRRMLLNVRANNEASRAFAVYVGQQLDITKYSTDAEAVRKANDRVALLTPIAKAYLTDTAFNATLDAQMCFGGHGYIREWGMEQCVRDLRIAQIYEGTNGVQSQDLIVRKTIKCNGEFIAEYIAEIRDFTNGLDADLNFIKDATLDAATEVESVTQYVLNAAKENVDFPNAAAVDYLHAVGLLSFSYMFARIANAAKDKDGEFYQNKLSLALYFVQRILPELALRITKVKAGAEVVMNFSEDYFTNQS